MEVSLCCHRINNTNNRLVYRHASPPVGRACAPPLRCAQGGAMEYVPNNPAYGLEQFCQGCHGCCDPLQCTCLPIRDFQEDCCQVCEVKFERPTFVMISIKVSG